MNIRRCGEISWWQAKVRSREQEMDKNMEMRFQESCSRSVDVNTEMRLYFLQSDGP